MSKGMQGADEATRERVARAGGIGRAAAMTAQERRDSARVAARAAHRPAALARRIVDAWPTLSLAERAEVRAILSVARGLLG